MANTSIQKLVSNAVIELIYYHNTIAQVVMNCGGVKVIGDDRVPAIAFTDGKGIYINEPYIQTAEKLMGKKFTLKNYMFIIAHEAMHLMTLTIDRKGNRDHELWNQATDYAINSILFNNRPDTIGTMPDFVLYNYEYINMSAEDIYKKLTQEKRDQENNQSGDGKGDGQSGNSGSGNNQSNLSKEELEELIKEFESLSPEERQERIREAKLLNLDKHMTIDEKTAESISARVSDILQKSCGKDSDTCIQRAIEMRPKPKFPWKQMLIKYIKSYMIEDRSYARPSKRSNAVGKYLPHSTQTPKLSCAFGIDTSGSISPETLSNMFNHIVSILRSFKEFNIELHCFSTEVHKGTIKTITKNQTNQFNILKDYQIDSNGGTDIKSSFDYIANHRNNFDLFICMTDGCDNIDNLEFKRTPVIWAITDDKDHMFKSPSGVKNAKVIFIDEDKE